MQVTNQQDKHEDKTKRIYIYYIYIPEKGGDENQPP